MSDALGNHHMGMVGESHDKSKSTGSTHVVVDIDSLAAWFERSIFDWHGQMLPYCSI